MDSNLADFYGLPFETDYMLFASDELEEIPAVYVVYTTTACLEIGEAPLLKTAIEEHLNTTQWIKLANKDDIYIAFHPDDDVESRIDKMEYLKSKMKPLISP